MTGRQLKIQGIGSTNEAFCEAMLGRFASMVPVPREHDYGIDFYCLPRSDLGARCESVTELCGIQTKGARATGTSFGGADDSGSWRKHQLDWLRTLSIPLYLAVVDDAFSRLDLYSITRCLQVFWKTGYPFRIDCDLHPPSFGEPVETLEPQPTATIAPQEHDGNVWSVDLGAPLLSLTFSDLLDDTTRLQRRDVLLHWIARDRWSLNNMINEIPRVRLPQNYLTNGVPSGEQHLMFWNAALHSRPGRIAEVIVPAVVTIARHLIAQGKKEEAREWLGPLRWSRARGYLEQFGVDVIAELEGDQQPGAATPPDVPVSPAEY